ncbi:MAG: hypothetical protein ABIC82_03915 [bacterium]
MNLSAKNFLIQFNKDIFTVSIISFVVLFFLELIKPKFVIAYINLNYVLLLCLITGIFIVFFEKQIPAENLPDESKIKKSILLTISIMVFIFIMFFTYDLGMWSILISLVGGVVAFLLGLTLW